MIRLEFRLTVCWVGPNAYDTTFSWSILLSDKELIDNRVGTFWPSGNRNEIESSECEYIGEDLWDGECSWFSQKEDTARLRVSAQFKQRHRHTYSFCSIYGRGVRGSASWYHHGWGVSCIWVLLHHASSCLAHLLFFMLIGKVNGLHQWQVHAYICPLPSGTCPFSSEKVSERGQMIVLSQWPCLGVFVLLLLLLGIFADI